MQRAVARASEARVKVTVYVSGNLSMKSKTVVTASMGVIKAMTAKNCGKKPIRMQLIRIGTSTAWYRL